MPGPENTLPMMGGDGPFGSVGMGGMFTILKVRDQIDDLEKAKSSWYNNPPGTVAESINKGMENNEMAKMDGMNHQGMDMDNMQMGNKAVDVSVLPSESKSTVYVCPMHPEVRQLSPGKCPKCGMTLQPESSQKDSAEKATSSDQPQDHKHMNM